MNNLSDSSPLYLVEEDIIFNNIDELIDYLNSKHQLKRGDDLEVLIAPVINTKGILSPDLTSQQKYYFAVMNQGLVLIGEQR